MAGFKGALSNFIFERLCFPHPSFATLCSFSGSRRDQLMSGYPTEPLGGLGGRLRTTAQRFGDTVCLTRSLATGLRCLELSPHSSASSSPLHGRTPRSAETALLVVLSPGQELQQHRRGSARNAHSWIPPRNSQTL